MFRIGIESSVEPKRQYSPVPQTKFTNVKIFDSDDVAKDFKPTSAGRVSTDLGYKRTVCPDGSLIAGTATELDCKLIITKNSRPAVEDVIRVIDIKDDRSPKILLNATDGDNEYVFYEITEEPKGH